MDRLTKALRHNFYVVDEANVQHEENVYSGGAVSKLARFENMYDDLITKQTELTDEMAKLRLEGKTNTVKFKQLWANKMMNHDIILLFETYGL